jgi:hypothetical protein
LKQIRIRDLVNPGSGMENNPGSATLLTDNGCRKIAAGGKLHYKISTRTATYLPPANN